MGLWHLLSEAQVTVTLNGDVLLSFTVEERLDFSYMLMMCARIHFFSHSSSIWTPYIQTKDCRFDGTVSQI